MERIKSPRTDDDGIEQEIKAKGLTAPRVTKADLDANIVQVEIVKHVAPAGQVLRWAVLTTRNGFAVTGRPSAAVSPKNDDADLGERLAVENAKNELWALMGYELRSRLADEACVLALALATEGCAMDFPRYELLQWRNPATDKPDTDMTVALVTAADGFISGYWDDGLKHWIDCASGGEVETPVLAWADPAGPENLKPMVAAEIPADQVRAALQEALDLLRGWVDHKCPKKYRADHLAVIDTLAQAGGV